MRSFPVLASLSAAAMFVATACTTAVQTSSGADYLDRAGISDLKASALDAEEFRAAASIEPLLTFPARFGIARIEGGRLTPIPEDEMAAWEAVQRETQGDYGSFVPLNLLVTAMVLPKDLLEAVDRPQAERITGNHHSGYQSETVEGGMVRARAAMDAIRLGAARQHLDAVLVYEVFGASDSKQSALSLANLTILGAFLVPGSKVDAVGHAEAILVDVRNGYPYVTASKTVTREALAASARSWGRGEELAAAAQARAVADLAADMPQALAELAADLGEESPDG